MSWALQSSDSPLSVCLLAHKKRQRKEAREAKADAAHLEKENMLWEEAEAIVDEDDFQQLLRQVEIDSQRMADMNRSYTSKRNRAKGPSATPPYVDGYQPMEEAEASLLTENERLENRCKKLKAEIKRLRLAQRRYAPYGHNLPRSNTHQRRSGKRLTDDERRAVLHCYEMCEKEFAQRIVSTAAPIQRTAHYLGMASKTVQSALLGIKTRDKRGRYVRTLAANVYEEYIRNLVKVWNKEGKPVTLKKLHKKLRDFWGASHQIPSRESLRQHLLRMGYKYNHASKARNHVDTVEIRIKRRTYLEERYSDKYKGALFVWLDESYVHHHHVHGKVQYFIEVDTVQLI